MTKPSPIRVGNCKPWPFKTAPGSPRRQLCEWVCHGRVRGAAFSSRRGAAQIAILHPSTKRVGHWQVSFFDDAGPVRDVLSPTCQGALRAAGIKPAGWRLSNVE